jgi:hypothetical protein
MTEMETENQTAKRQYYQQYQRKAYNSRSKYDREKKEQQSVLQLVSQPSKSWESKDVVFQKMKQKIDEHISSNRLL